MKLVILESPWQGGKPQFRDYLTRAIADCISRGESPYASHRMLTDALDDNSVQERATGIAAGFAWHQAADASVVYLDYGVTEGMRLGIAHAQRLGLPVEHRFIGRG